MNRLLLLFILLIPFSSQSVFAQSCPDFPTDCVFIDGFEFSCPLADVIEGRPSPPICEACRSEGWVDQSSGGECLSDTDCSEGENGRCNAGRAGNTCTYDECFTDGDCRFGTICSCDTGVEGINHCINAACTTDDECGGFTCSISLGACGNFFPPVGAWCHSNEDECQSDSDCPGEGESCRYNNGVTPKWECSDMQCSG